MQSSGCIALLAVSLATGVSVSAPTPAAAANFFERLFAPPSRERPPLYDSNVRGPAYGYESQRGYYGNGGGYPYGTQPRPNVGQETTPPPRPVAKVAAPKYYTYKPDKPTVATLDKLTDPVTTASVTADGSPSLGDNPFEELRRYLSDIRIRALPEVIAALKAHYSAKPHFIWVSGSAPNGKAKAVVAVLADAASVGLDPQDYKVDVPSDGYDMNDPAARQKSLMRFEMQLSAAALTYDLDAQRGRVAADRISGYHDLPRKKVDLEAALSTIESNADAASWLADQNPKGPQFKELEAELAKLRAAGPSEQVKIDPATLVRPGGSSAELPNVVQAIRLYASDDLKSKFSDTLANYAGSTDYSPDLVSLVKAFQKEKGLGTDGVIGKNTIAAMTGFSNADKIDKVVLAMERARWLPGVLPAERVFVNEAAFDATYFKDDRPQISTRVIVGQKSHQTYFFSDEIETVEFNPYWGVPQSIIINEMLPKLRQNPNYLDRMGYQLEYHGKDISSTSVNWNQIGSTKAFSVRQPPGQDNALGQLKILFPNSHAIYLHDTPTKSLFKQSVRDFSHGCVRMQDPRGMAAEVLGVSRQKVADYINSGKNQGVDVPHKIPVFLAYFTAWPGADGKVQFYGDVYDRDMYLDRAIAATEDARHAEG